MDLGAPRDDGPFAGSVLASKLENSRLLREDVARGATVYRALPECVVLNSTDVCNLRCTMCQRSVSQGTHRLEDRVVRHVCDELFPTAWKAMLTTAGGEPLGAGFETILERALRHGVRIDVMTNGILIDRALARDAWPAFDHVNVSVDCCVPEVYERIRVGARFEQLLAALEAIREQRRDGRGDALVSLSAVVMASTLPHLAELVRFAAAHGLDGVLLQKLRHEVHASPAEEPARSFAPEAIESALLAAEDASRETGVALFATELGRLPVLPRPLRSKVPLPLEGTGQCVFLAQYFSVMYTGEVYPCCKPTDHVLGSVLHDDPVEIWNGAPFQRLRRAHLSRRGTLFCTGCEHAPHLGPSRAPSPAVAAARLLRRGVGHHWNALVRRRRARREPRVYEAEPLAHASRPFVERPPPPVAVRPLGRGQEAVAVERDGALLFASSGALFRADGGGGAQRVADLPPGYVAGLAPLSCGSVLVSLETGGGVLRVGLGDREARAVSTLSDPRSFVRGNALVETEAGIFAGEYGLFPGARVANLWRSRDGGRSFERILHLGGARHVHCVWPFPDDAELLVTTGDSPRQRVAWRVPLVAAGVPTPRVWLRPWAGFTAACATERHVHLGTDLSGDNALLRMRRGAREPPESTPLPAELDLAVRALVPLGGGALVALLACDDGAERAGRSRAALLHSDDEGESWSVLRAFAHDAPDAPEALALLRTGRRPLLVTARTREACTVEIGAP